MDPDTAPTFSPERKPSRYRSQRRAPTANNDIDIAPHDHEPGATSTDTVDRSRSRYHRTQVPSNAQLDQSVALRHGAISRPTGRPAPLSVDAGNAELPSRSNEDVHRAQQSARSRNHAYDSARPTSSSSKDSGEPRASPQYKRKEPSGSTFSCFGLFKSRSNETPIMNGKSSPDSSRMHAKQPAYVKQGGGGIVPGTDAPQSEHDRRVLVQCNGSSTLLPVTPVTTPAELIRAAAKGSSEHIDARSSVLVEYFAKVGVQRPIRRYERIVDIMNGWDDDAQNVLRLVPAAVLGCDPAALHSSYAPRVRPAECSFFMHYSQKVGKWDTRHITIRPDGQIVAYKKLEDIDATNICHLSDFDIYTPTAKQTTNKIKPPKRLCFAIKSQQKSSLFESTSDFVHFFSTGDQTDGAGFLNAVQGWRSWYLVHVMGEGRAQPTLQESSLPAPGSLEHSKIQELASFPSRGASTRQGRLPTSPQMVQLGEDEPLANLIIQESSTDHDSEAFTSNGLLGRVYSLRQSQDQERTLATAQAFTSGTSLLNPQQASDTSPRRSASSRQPARQLDSEMRRTTSTRSNNHNMGNRTFAQPSTNLGRTSSSATRREQPKPLVDLTPTYREPPQHVKKGGAFIPDEVGPGGLVESATSIEQAIVVPAAVDWRARPAQQQLPVRTGSRRVERDRERDKGVNSQAYAALHGGRAPLVELHEQSRFVPGSLLAKAEMQG